MEAEILTLLIRAADALEHVATALEQQTLILQQNQGLLAEAKANAMAMLEFQKEQAAKADNEKEQFLQQFSSTVAAATGAGSPSVLTLAGETAKPGSAAEKHKRRQQ